MSELANIRVKVMFPEGMEASGGGITLQEVYEGMKMGWKGQPVRNPEVFIASAVNNLIDEAITKYKRTNNIPILGEKDRAGAMVEENGYWKFSNKTAFIVGVDLIFQLFSKHNKRYDYEIIQMQNVLKDVADRLERIIKNSILANVRNVPLNAEEYRKRKGGKNPFINTGKLLNNIHIGLFADNRLLYQSR